MALEMYQNYLETVEILTERELQLAEKKMKPENSTSNIGQLAITKREKRL